LWWNKNFKKLSVNIFAGNIENDLERTKFVQECEKKQNYEFSLNVRK